MDMSGLTRRSFQTGVEEPCSHNIALEAVEASLGEIKCSTLLETTLSRLGVQTISGSDIWALVIAMVGRMSTFSVPMPP